MVLKQYCSGLAGECRGILVAPEELEEEFKVAGLLILRKWGRAMLRADEERVD
jgi:hypothetical protein